MIRNELKGHGSMFSANIMWGLMSPVAKSIFIGSAVTPLLLVDMRVLGAAVLFWIASLFMPRERVPFKDILRLFVASMLGIVFNQGLFTIGLGMTSPVDASVITTSTPILTMVIAALYLKEPVTGKKIGGVLIGAAGALVLVLSNTAGERSGSVLGDVLCIAAELSFASYLVFFKDIISRYSPVTLMKWMFTFASICIVPFSATDLLALDLGVMSVTTVWSLVFVVCCATFVCYMLSPVGQKYLRPTIVSMYCYVQPVVAACVVVFKEGISAFTLPKAVAIVLVFVGVYIVTRSKSRADVEAARRSAGD